MATFRTDRETGRTVISSENQVGSDGMTDLERANVAAGGLSGVFDDPRFTDAREARGVSRDIASVPLTFDQFMTSTGRTALNPYGDQGFFSRVLGIDPSKISYTNNIPGGGAGIAQLNALAYDRYMNPAARTNIFGDPVGGDPTTGQLRFGIQPGDLTRFGRAVEGRREGIAGVLDSLPFGIGLASRMFGSTPARVPGFDVQEVVPQLGLGGPQPGMGVDPASRFPQGPFPTDEIISAGQDAATTAFGDMAPVRSAEELIAAAYGDSPTSVQNLPTGTDGSATMTKTSPGARPRRTINERGGQTLLSGSLPTQSSIPTRNEVIQDRIARNQMRINEALEELKAGTAGFPEVIPSTEELMASPITTSSVRKDVTVGDETARLMGENRTVQEIENQLVSQGVSRPQARNRANKAVYGFGDATLRTSMSIGRGADPMGAAFEAGLPSDLLAPYGL